MKKTNNRKDKKGLPKLTPQQERFVIEFFNHNTQKAAAIAAGYSSKTADKIACKLVDNCRVKAHLDFKRAEMEKKDKARQDKIRASVDEISFCTIYDFAEVVPVKDREGIVIGQKFYLKTDIDRGKAKAIQCIETHKDGSLKKLSLVDKNRTLELNAKLSGMFTVKEDGEEKQGEDIAVNIVIGNPPPDVRQDEKE